MRPPKEVPQEPTTPIETPMPILNNTMHSKYESMYILAQHGMSPQQVVELTLADIVVKGDTMTVKGIQLSLEDAKVIAKYLHEFGKGIKKHLFYGINGVQSAAKGIKRSVATHLKKYHQLKLSDIGWIENKSPKPVKTPIVINSFADIQRIVDELQRDAKKTPS